MTRRGRGWRAPILRCFSPGFESLPGIGVAFAGWRAYRESVDLKTSKMKRKLTSEHLSYRCPLKWEDFSHADGEHYCHKCERTILDLTECTIEDAIELQKRNGLICGFVTLAGAAALSGLSSCSPAKETHNSGQSDSQEVVEGSIPVPGYICPPEELAGGKDR